MKKAILTLVIALGFCFAIPQTASAYWQYTVSDYVMVWDGSTYHPAWRTRVYNVDDWNQVTLVSTSYGPLP